MPDRAFLIVEDDDAVARGLARWLSLVGPVECVGTVAEARVALGSKAWAGLILDLTLPDGSGFEVLEYARTLDETLPALILTGHLNRDVANRSFDLGAAYVVKPIEKAQIEAFARHGRLSFADESDPTLNGRAALVIEEWGRRHGLTAIEKEILAQGVRGSTRAEIAVSRGTTESTIKNQIASLKKKTKDRTLRHAVVRVLREAAQRDR
jgi:DNA-binding NarL/FixJ family response regulator